VIDFDADVIVTIPRGSTEPVVARLKSPTGANLTATTLDISVGTDATTYSWVAAEWADATVDSDRVVRSTSSRAWSTAGDYIIHVRLDNAQIIRCSNIIRVP
jgi:hypothetical protein